MVRFGIAGFGLHAVKRLMPGFAQAKRCRVTALSRRDLQQAKESAQQFEIQHAFASTAELCACPEVDAVFVSSPDGLHHDDVLEADPPWQAGALREADGHESAAGARDGAGGARRESPAWGGPRDAL